MPKAEVCALSNISTVQVLLMNIGSTSRPMPNAIDGLSALMANI